MSAPCPTVANSGCSLREMFSEDERILGMPLEEAPTSVLKNPGKGN